LLTVFGAAVAARRGDHLAVTLVHDMLPPVLQRVIFLISLLLSLGLLAMSAWFSWQSVINMIDSGIRSYGLGLPAWYYQIGVPFGFALVLIRYLQHAIDVMRGGVDDTGLPDV
jgi:TRAP-type C4-dicarboxylate transport system permease small subunit